MTATLLLATVGVTWIENDEDSGWQPVAYRAADAEPVPVTDTFQGPQGFTKAQRYARRIHWQIDTDGTLSLQVATSLPNDVREVLVLDVPTALIERQCFGCKETVRGNVTDCPDCKAEHDTDGCCDYESDLSEPVFVCRICGAEDVKEVDADERWNDLSITDDGYVTASLGDSGNYDGTGFICGSCMAPTALPAGYDEIVSWD